MTLGETLALLQAPRIGPLRRMSSLDLGIAGAESNVAVGISRLGHGATWMGCVGDDELGRLIIERLRGEDVDVQARVIRSSPTALMLREHRTQAVTRVAYYRDGLAGSQLGTEDADALTLGKGDILHITGITPALGRRPAEAVMRAAERARRFGARISFDVNYRGALWTSSAAAGPLSRLARLADVLFASEDELELIAPSGAGRDSLHAAREMGPKEVVLKMGASGARALGGGEDLTMKPPRVVVVDPVGAGDAFVAGYLSGILDGLPLAGRLERANALGAFAVTAPGDWESLPRRSELDLLESPAGTTLR